MNQQTMNYKGYTATIHHSDEENCYIGRVVGIRHIITSRGSTLSELYEDFKEMIDWYLEDCEKDGIGPNEPPTEIMVPLPTELYAKAYSKAENTGIPIQKFMQNVIQQAVS